MEFRIGLNWEAFKPNEGSGGISKTSILVLNAVTFDKNGKKLKQFKCPALVEGAKKQKDKQSFAFDLQEFY